MKDKANPYLVDEKVVKDAYNKAVWERDNQEEMMREDGYFNMTENMMQEILDDWMSWKYDIIEMNNSEWTVRDESKLNMIGVILEEKMKEFKGDK